jgi:hypothetical protein
MIVFILLLLKGQHKILSLFRLKFIHYEVYALLKGSSSCCIVPDFRTVLVLDARKSHCQSQCFVVCVQGVFPPWKQARAKGGCMCISSFKAYKFFFA